MAPIDPAWDAGMRRPIEVGGCTCWVVMLPMREASGRPKWELTWQETPIRLSQQHLAHFDRELAKAKAAILAYVESLQEVRK